MHGKNGRDMPEPEERLSQELKTDLKDGLDWQWLKVVSEDSCIAISPLTGFCAQLLQQSENHVAHLAETMEALHV